jgi:uncharacterized membrane protein
MEPTPDQPTEESIFQEADFSMEGYDKHIRNARILLYVVAGLTLLALANMKSIDTTAQIVAVVLQVLFAGVFVALALWTKKKPYTALLCALIFYLFLEVAGDLLNPANIFRGWILKIVIIILLILGMRNGRESQNMMEAFGKKQ